MAKNLQIDQSLYRALDISRAEIRLLILPDSGAVDNASISTSFRIVSLHESPEFYALSYVWGSPTMTQPLYIDGSEVLISPNLEHIIGVLLSHKKGLATIRGKAIWIDALCIDPGNIAEKGQQISLMGQIYRQATRVLMWLGDAEGHADWAMKYISDPDFYLFISALEKTRKAPTADEIKLKLIMQEDLEKRAYWTRVWIGQELVLASNDPLVLCGRYCVPWSHYVNFLRWLPGHRGDYPEVTELWDAIANSIPSQRGFRSSVLHRSVREMYIDHGRKGVDLSFALKFTSRLNASEPRDFIYGSLGTIKPESMPLIIPEYTKSVAEVFKEAFRNVWLFAPNPIGDVQLLFSFHRVIGSPDGLPSWAPDIANHTLPEFQKDIAGIDLNGRSRAGTANWKPPKRPTFDGDIILLEAIEFDKLDNTESVIFNHGWSPTFTDEDTHDQMVATLKMAEAMRERGLQRQIPDNDRLACFRGTKSLDPIWKTMSYWRGEVVGSEGEKDHHDLIKCLPSARPQRVLLPDIEPGSSISSVEREWMLLWDILMRRQDIPKPWKEATSEVVQNDERKLKATILNRILHAISSRIGDRKIFLTKNGFFGVATRHVKEGDVIVFVAGMQCLYVLRPFQDGYQMKGCAYVSGLMIWEVLDDCLEKSGIVPKQLKIY